MNTKRDVLLDAWRGVAVLLVIFDHWTLNPSAVPAAPWLANIASYSGNLGVRLFFVISGFIITKLLLEERDRSGSISLQSFYARRIFRILPPLAVLLLVVASLNSFGWAHVPNSSFVSASAFLCNVRDCTMTLEHLWSLAIEEQFYIAWPLIVLMLPRKSIPYAAAVLMLGCGLLGFFVVIQPKFGYSFASIAAGTLYASSPRVREVIANHRSVWIAWLPVLLWPFNPLPDSLQLGMSTILMPVLLPMVIFSTYQLKPEKTLLVRALSAVGLISYGLYLYQQPFILEESNHLWPWLFVPLAVASFFLIERPMIRCGKDLAKGSGLRALNSENPAGRTIGSCGESVPP